MLRELSYMLCFLVLMLVSAQAGALDFQKDEEFSVRKAMFSIFGNVDEQNRSTFDISETKAHTENAKCPGVKLKSYTSTAVEWKAFTLNYVETVYLVTSAVPLNLEGGKVCPSTPPRIGLHVFQKKDGRWELSLSDKDITEAGYDGAAVVDLVKIGKDQVALAINDGASDERESARWTELYSLVGDQIEILLIQSMYRDNQGACSMERGPGEVFLDLDDIRDMPEEELAALLDTCHRFKTDIYVFPSDSKFYALKTITVDTIDWKGPDGERLTPNRLELDYRFPAPKNHHKYGLTSPAPATGPMVPLFDENSNYQKRRKSLEKRPSETVKIQ